MPSTTGTRSNSSSDMSNGSATSQVVVELQHNLVFGDTAARRAAGPARRPSRARATPRPATSTTTVQERHRLQDVLVAIQHRTTLDGSHRERRPNASSTSAPPKRWRELFARYPRGADHHPRDRRAVRGVQSRPRSRLRLPRLPDRARRNAGRAPGASVCRDALEAALSAEPRTRRPRSG